MLTSFFEVILKFWKDVNLGSEYIVSLQKTGLVPPSYTLSEYGVEKTGLVPPSYTLSEYEVI